MNEYVVIAVRMAGEDGVTVQGKHIKVLWNGWGFTTEPSRFVRWVYGGYLTTCANCFIDKLRRSLDYNRECGHAMFEGDCDQVSSMLTTIEMGLL